MSEENVVVQGTENQTNVEPQTPADPYEEQAKEQGWVPKEEYTGDPNKWRGAKEFVERGELFGKIDNLSKDLKETKKALKFLQEHHAKVRETEFGRAVSELKALQKKHLEEGNPDAYLEATELLTDLKAEQKAREVVQAERPQQNQPDPRFVAWVNQNQWYASNKEMREYADALGTGYANQNPGTDPEDVLKYVASQVKARFQDKFKNPNREKPSAVEGAASTTTTKDRFKLSDDETKVMRSFVRTGVMTEQEFIDEVKRMRG